MARARNLKPSIFKNEILGTSDPLYTILFEGLWCNCDREGRLEDRPMRLKAEIFPYRENIDMSAMLTWLHDMSFITRYSVDGNNYIQIIQFLKHQKPHKNETDSIIPGPDQGSAQAQPRNGFDHTKDGSAQSLTLNPIPLTLNPIVSGSPPDNGSPKRKTNSEYKTEAIEVLTFLNEITGREYRFVEGTLAPIVARLKSDATVEDCRTVVVRKWREWKGDAKMQAYLRPKTLFSRENFENYLGECVTK